MENRPKKNNLLMDLEPRLKILTFAVMALVIVFTPKSCVFRFAAYGTFLVFLLILSRPDIKSLVQRFLFLLPLLLFLTLSVILFGEKGAAAKLDILWNLGIKSVLVFLCFAVYQMSTPVFRFLNALEKMPLPRVFPALLGFAVRYVSLFSEEIIRKTRAWRSRCFVHRNRKQAVRFFRYVMPGVLMRTVERSDRIYAAMLSRGYNGRMPIISLSRMDANDWIFFGIVAVVFGSVWIFL